MKKTTAAALALAFAALAAPAAAQNIAVVNGKAVPKSRLDTLIKRVTEQAAPTGQPLPPNLEALARDQVVMDEIFYQEAMRRGLFNDAEYKAQVEAARQGLLIGALFRDVQKKSAVTDAEIAAKYEELKAANAGTEYRARHILVEKEEQAKALIAQIKGGAKFEELAKKNSKDPGSAENGGDLDFAAPGNYVPEFSGALVKLKKGEMTDTPVKSQFGYHIIKLEDTRAATFPTLQEVTPQLRQHLEQLKMGEFRKGLIKNAKTDYKFSE